MLVVNSKRALTIGLMGWVTACSGESTPLASHKQADSRGTTGTQPESGCGSYIDGAGEQLVDPPGACFTSYVDCDNDHIYQLTCDGLECTCVLDGSPQLSLDPIRTPRCLSGREATELCEWPSTFNDASPLGLAALQGLPCEDASDPGDCECVDGRMMCPGAGGCNVVGNFIPEDSTGPALHFRADGTFYAADSSDASYEDVASGNADGFYGTWSLSDALLSVRSHHPASGDPTCDREPGRYTATFNDDCQLTALEAIDEPCSPRAVLTTPLAPL